MKSRRQPGRELGSKYLGRSLREFRLSAGLSQEELARRSSVSVATVGSVERERARISEQTLCKLCFALEETAGRPMLREVFESAMVTFWNELQSVESQFRKDRGLALAEWSLEPSIEEQFRRLLDEYIEAERALLTLGYRLAAGEELNRERAPVPKTAQRRARVRRRQGAAKPA